MAHRPPALLKTAEAAQLGLGEDLRAATFISVVLPFLVDPARPLLERQRRGQTAHPALISQILDLLPGPAAPGPPRGGQAGRARDRGLDEPLTDSETRVPRYLPTHLTAPEIAAELWLSVNTVNTHMRHVYAKLGVHRRQQAVNRARALGLLASSGRSNLRSFG